MERLANKTALITGGSRGIGAAIAIKMADAGARVAITFKSARDQALITQRAILAKGGECAIFQADIRDRGGLTEVFATLGKRWGKLDILVNNAGINIPTDFDKITDDQWDDILDVNLKGPFICSQLALHLLQASGTASIINISSVSGQYGGPRTAHYAASKAGLISLSQVVARFGSSLGIRSNTIAVGIIESSMGNTGLQSPVVVKAAENIMLKRIGEYDDVAQAAIFLASDESKYITAQTINVNGGLYF